MNILKKMTMNKELQEKLDFWNNLRDEIQVGDVPVDLKYQMLSEVEYQIVVIEEQLDKLMQDKTINAMTVILIAFCGAATGLFGYAMTVKYLL
jgi:chromosome condensin MukBEF complex kleisin-like MukF subunit